MPKRTKSSASPEAAIKAWIPSGDVRKNTTSVPWFESHILWSCYHPQKEGDGNIYVCWEFRRKAYPTLHHPLATTTSGTISGENMWNQDLLLGELAAMLHRSQLQIGLDLGFFQRFGPTFQFQQLGSRFQRPLTTKACAPQRNFMVEGEDRPAETDLVFGTNKNYGFKWKCP